MQQYFLKQPANCCQLNFSNTLAFTPKYIISPKKTLLKHQFVTNKSSKKSLKAFHSHHTSKDKQKQTRFQQQKTHYKQKEQQLNDYGQIIQRNDRMEINQFQNIKKLKFSAQDSHIKQFRSEERKQFLQSLNKPFCAEQLRSLNFSQKPANFVKLERQQQPRGSVLVKTVNTFPTFRHQHLSPQTIQRYYRQGPNPLIQSANFQPANLSKFHKILTHTRSPARKFEGCSSNPFQVTRNILSKTPILKKQSSTNYSQNFKKIYGEVEIEDEIKHDLMVSLQFNKHESQQDNGVSMLTKCPPSEESTILPPQSKLKQKSLYQTDAFATNNSEQKVCTQKYLKSDSFLGYKPQTLGVKGRQKFKSIISVESQHSSSQEQGLESVIIDQHAHRMLNSKQIKSLL